MNRVSFHSTRALCVRRATPTPSSSDERSYLPPARMASRDGLGVAAAEAPPAFQTAMQPVLTRVDPNRPLVAGHARRPSVHSPLAGADRSPKMLALESSSRQSSADSEWLVRGSQTSDGGMLLLSSSSDPAAVEDPGSAHRCMTPSSLARHGGAGGRRTSAAAFPPETPAPTKIAADAAIVHAAAAAAAAAARAAEEMADAELAAAALAVGEMRCLVVSFIL